MEQNQPSPPSKSLQREAVLLHKRLQHLMGKALGEFSLIEEGDRILLGLSGGKDSLALLELLGDRMRRSGGRFRVEALHVRMENVQYKSDLDYLRKQAAAQGIPFHVADAAFDPDRNERRSPCFLCSWHRRKVFFNLAQEWGCQKIALGHHLDDLLHTALLNLTFNGSFSTMPVKLALRKMPLTLIRPLAFIPEADLRRWAELQGYRKVEKVCPFDRASNRTSVGSAMQAIEQLNPDYRSHLLQALRRAGALEETPGGEDGCL